MTDDSTADGYVFENLGRPFEVKPVAIAFVTREDGGRHVAWGAVEAPDKRGVFGIDVDSGKTVWLDTAPYGRSHIRVHKAQNGNVYIYAGSPGHFFKYDIRDGELIDLGVPAEETSYWLGHAVGPDGRFYVGSYPATHLVWADPATDEVGDLGQIADDPREKYIIHPAMGDDNVIFCPVGLHHQELWACDVDTGVKTQILPEDLTKSQGAPKVWVGTDGRVYGEADGKTFLCKADGIEYRDPESRRGEVRDNRVGEFRAIELSAEGELKMTHAETGEEKTVKADFEGASVMVYSVCCEHNGKIYGGGFQPASTFELDPETGHITDLGRLSTGRIQVYDMLSHPKGIFLSSYTGSNLDFYKPSSGEKKPIATLSETHEQERAQQFALGPDGRIYTGTIPIKGLLGGAVVRLDPGDFSILVWRNVVPNQSFKSVVAVDRTGEIFFASSISGGTSAIPSEGEACVMLWDIQREEMSWNAKPIPGATDYSRAVMAANGLIYGLAGSERSEALFGRPGEAYYVFDPTRREVVYTGVLPVGGVHWPGMVPAPAGPEGLIIGLGEDAVFAIDPSDHSARILARHDSIPQSRGMFATASGVLYYGSGPFLMRVDLYPGR